MVFFFLAKETYQIFLFIVICVAKVLFFQAHAFCHVKIILACTLLKKYQPIQMIFGD